MRPTLKTHLDAVIHFICEMDVEMVATLLDDQRTYQDFSKSLFIRKLGDLFFEFEQLGDTQLLLDRGQCYGCSCGSSGYSFVGNKSMAYIDIVFIRDEDQKVTDIYECDDFLNKSPKLRKRNRLFLDKYVDFEMEDDEDDFFGDNPMRDDDDMPF